ncbi:hypothetical protein V5P93_007348 [Actinokineospora auranticolor]|uniref:DUF6802 domain-containing protein n=1 Tax=Actinokineospora auranticolor TaxID=155976 RepID=A0A2S6GS13_9PSEU|nr:DUF6802 family protein [Actinokineospora auranticolor]PPK68000.1 hypothetical protein CLV40_106233 [Actinokineospora auranticolor]
MYVDETGADTTTDDTSVDETGHDELTVEIGGDTYEVTENYDYDGDGHNDTVVVQTEDGFAAFTDTDGDGQADTAVTLDEQGNVTGAAEYDEASSQWTAADPNSVENPSGDGADNGGGHSGHTGSTDTADGPDSTPVDHNDGGGNQITVDNQGGDINAGEAQYDVDGDGKNDTAVVTDEQGNTYAFTDVDGDGSADQAVVVEADGDVTVAQHTGDDEWTAVETGHINADGTYESDSTADGAAPTAAGSDASASDASGSDASWQG